ncbi:MAG TPA: cation:proton antiporter regulatory subunit [Acidimicrobiales bacterium]|nr:cation:proton antiporter regulatory subunit [Acidimicrobiales bacterium]
MTEVQETQLPGVGVRHDFETETGQRVGVVVHRDGRREVLVYDTDDPDACSSLLELSSSDTRTVAELLGASQVTEAVAAVQQDIEGLAIEWFTLGASSPAVGATIRDGEYRSRTGVSVVAVIRGDESVPAPAPDFMFGEGDIAVAVGTLEGLARLRTLLSS